MTASFGQVATFDPDAALIVGEDDPQTRRVVLASGQARERGALLGKITTSGKYTLAVAAESDGSQNPVAILAEATDATSGDKETVAHFGGSFNERAIVYGAGHSAVSVREALRDLGMKLHSSMDF